MFSFHKPKVYRSSTGCCICKAKSSSSRFTDSKKYEEDFVKCFQLEERRTGEICNACVLLVKRWKKLPVGSSRNWRHVVDARAGPGIKSLTKFKAKNKKKSKESKDVEKFDKILKKKHVYLKNDREREQSPAMSDDLTDEYLAGTGSKGSSRAGSPAGSDDTAVGEQRLNIDEEELKLSNFIDLTYFKRKNVCCGVIFVGKMGEVLIEPSFFKPCAGCLAREQRRRETAVVLAAGASPAHSTSSAASASPCHSSASTSPAHSVESGTEGGGNSKPKGFCDSSSDSGYDDSNQGMIIAETKKSQQQVPKQQLLKTAHSLRVITKPAKPAVKTHQSILPVATTLRLKTSSGATAKMPIKLLCKPVALVSSAKLSLSSTGSVSARSIDTATATTTVLTVPASAVDFAVRPPPHRQSLAN